MAYSILAIPAFDRVAGLSKRILGFRLGAAVDLSSGCRTLVVSLVGCQYRFLGHLRDQLGRVIRMWVGWLVQSW